MDKPLPSLPPLEPPSSLSLPPRSITGQGWGPVCIQIHCVTAVSSPAGEDHGGHCLAGKCRKCAGGEAWVPPSEAVLSFREASGLEASQSHPLANRGSSYLVLLFASLDKIPAFKGPVAWWGDRAWEE